MICGIINAEVRVTSRAEGEADNSYRDIDNFAYQKSQKPNPIIVLLYIVSEENKHGEERIDLFGKLNRKYIKNVVIVPTIDANEYRIL